MPIPRGIVILCAAVLIALPGCGIALGQAVSQITGTVKDESGASIPGVEITATQTDTATVRKVLTDDTGTYFLADLPIGPYRIEAAKAGFRTYIQTGIQLQVSSSPVIPVTLGVGEVSQTISVEADAAQVETEKLGVGTVMENQRVLDLPLNGRNATDLISLAPGAVQTGTSPSWSMNTGVMISIAGGQPYGVYYALDGAPHMSLYDATNMPLPFPDALQEFKVDTSTQDALMGMHSGAWVTSVTRSGGNVFHGDAFEFFRNGDLNARNFFSPTQDTLKRNQFGGVIGGPIRKNKIFFFGGYQGTELRQAHSPTADFVPTQAMLNGDFSAVSSPACNGGVQLNLAGRSAQDPFQNINGLPNQIPLSQISPVALAISAKLPPATNQCGQVLVSNLVSQYFWQVPVRVDYQLNDKQTIFGRYLITKQNQANPYSLTPNNLLTTTGVGLNDMAVSATVGHTWIISSSTINSFRVAYNRASHDAQGATFFGPSSVGINGYTYVPDNMQIAITGVATIGSGVNAQQHTHHTTGSINDDFSLIKGSHQFSLGASLMLAVGVDHADTYAVGVYTVGNEVTGLGLGDFVAGYLATMLQSLPNDLLANQWFFGLYGQDTWKVTRRLTVNYGLRWEPYFPIADRDDRVYTFSLARFYANQVSSVWTNAPPGFTYPGDPGFNGRSGIDTKWGDFEPRIGLAYDPFGDGKTSLRAGAGIAYDFFNMEMYQNADNVAPFAGETTVNGPIPLANPWITTPGGNPFPNYTNTPPIGVFPVGSTYQPVPPNLKTTQVYSWNAAVQRQITPNWFASVSYVGSKTNHLLDSIQLNPALYVPGNCVAGQYGLTASGPCSTTANINARRVLYLSNPVTSAPISYLTPFDDGGTANYNGMIADTRYRMNNNLSALFNYTWSHCIGLAGLGGGTASWTAYYVHQNDRNLDVGNCSFDRRNIVNATIVAETPKFANRTVNLIANGWQTSLLYRWTSGTPLTIGTGLTSIFGNSGERPNQVLANTAAANQGQACANVTPCVSWLNPAAFAEPATGTLGNMGVLNVLGPAFIELDAAIVRNFRIVEGHELQVRFEAFNFPNNVRYMTPAVALATSSTFGQLRSAYDPRILQIAMKYVF